MTKRFFLARTEIIIDKEGYFSDDQSGDTFLIPGEINQESLLCFCNANWKDNGGDNGEDTVDEFKCISWIPLTGMDGYAFAVQGDEKLLVQGFAFLGDVSQATA